MEHSLSLTQLHPKIDTINELQQLQQNILNDGYTNNNVSNEIINIIGGVDNILSFYLKISKMHDTSSLNESQIQLIHNILSKNYIDLKRENINTENQNDEILKQTLTFAPDNNYLNYLFGSNIGPKIKQIIFSKIIMSITAILNLDLSIDWSNPYQKIGIR